MVPRRRRHHTSGAIRLAQRQQRVPRQDEERPFARVAAPRCGTRWSDARGHTLRREERRQSWAGFSEFTRHACTSTSKQERPCRMLNGR